MPLTLDLSISDLADTRFAISPLSETISGLQLLGNCWGHDRHLRWVRWAVGELAARPLDLSRTWPLIVNDRPSWPQFLLPASAHAVTTIDDALAAMQQTSARHVRLSLHRLFGGHPPASATELAADPPEGLRAIATELRQAHDRLIAPHWGRLRAVLAADIAYRAKQLAAGGPGWAYRRARCHSTSASCATAGSSPENGQDAASSTSPPNAVWLCWIQIRAPGGLSDERAAAARPSRAEKNSHDD